MRNYLSALDKKVSGILKGIGQLADASGVQAYVVGGLVRDILLKKPNLDLDIVAEGKAIELARAYAAQVKGRLTVHEQFMTATVIDAKGLRIDFATARKEQYVSPGALPLVEPGTIQDDLFRRDFTINAMAVSLNSERWGGLVDAFHGAEDLRAKKIRILHPQSFLDDPTRILRAIRFEQRFGFKMEEKTREFLKVALRKDFPKCVKPERYFAEFRKMLEEEFPARCLLRLQALKGFGFIGKGVRIDLRKINAMQKAVAKLKNKLSAQDESWWLVYLVGIVYASSASALKSFGGRFNLNHHDREAVASLVQVKSLLPKLNQKGLQPSKIYFLLKPLAPEVIYFLYTLTTSQQVRRHLEQFLFRSRHVQIFLKGNDLKQVGIPEGKRIKYLLERLLSEKIDGRIHSRNDEVRKIKEWQSIS